MLDNTSMVNLMDMGSISGKMGIPTQVCLTMDLNMEKANGKR